MITRKISVTLLIFLLLFTCVNSFRGKAEDSTGILKAEKASDWTELFNQTSGWIGADGIFSIPVDGRDAIGSAGQDTKTYWVFSDSLIGTTDSENLDADYSMVNHTMALLTGNTPDKSKMHFIYGKNGDMAASNIFGVRMWLQDGIVIGDKMYLTGYVPAADWTPQTMSLITIPIVSGNPDLKNYSIKENIPLLYKNGSNYTMFGIGVMNNNSLSGASNPDGYIYVYGYNCGAYAVKKLVVARVLPQDYEDISKWMFWNGKAWSSDIKEAATDAAALSDNMISAELSVTPIPSGIYKGKYMLVYTPAGIGNQLAYSIGDSPLGIFKGQNVFYICREKQIYSEDMKKINSSGSIICYNAKAHPSLSKDGELLVSYNVNILGALPTKNQYYRPRFVTLNLNEVRKDNVVPQTIISSSSKVTASDNNSTAGNVTDGDGTTKWTSAASDKWLMLDLGSEKEISRFVIKHAGSDKEYTYLNTKEYKVQYSSEGRTWNTLYESKYGYENITDKIINPTKARYVKLIITIPTQSSIDRATIYSFDLYGNGLEQSGSNSDSSSLQPGTESGIDNSSGNAASSVSSSELVSNPEKSGSNAIILIFILIIALSGVLTAGYFIKKSWKGGKQ